jgi:hypothetical protein
MNADFKKSIENIEEYAEELINENTMLKLQLKGLYKKEHIWKELFGNIRPWNKVWIIGYEHEYSDCEICEGEKIIPVPIKDRVFNITCPNCNGNGRHSTKTYYPKLTSLKGISYKLKDNGDTKILVDLPYPQLPNVIDEVYETEEECWTAIREKRAKEM